MRIKTKLFTAIAAIAAIATVATSGSAFVAQAGSYVNKSETRTGEFNTDYTAIIAAKNDFPVSTVRFTVGHGNFWYCFKWNQSWADVVMSESPQGDYIDAQCEGRSSFVDDKGKEIFNDRDKKYLSELNDRGGKLLHKDESGWSHSGSVTVKNIAYRQKYGSRATSSWTAPNTRDCGVKLTYKYSES